MMSNKIEDISIKNLHQKLINDLGTIADKTILDYGCGRGNLVKLLLAQPTIPKLIYAVDIDPNAIVEINETYKFEIQQGEIITQVVDSPAQLAGEKFDRIVCHNVIECVVDKEQFVKNLCSLLNQNGVLLVSHHDFDSAVYHSGHKELTRTLIHFFADQCQAWQTTCDGQIGRKIPGIFNRAKIKFATFATWRIVETSFSQGDYGYLMAKMIIEAAKERFDQATLNSWLQDLSLKAQSNDFYFAIDVMVAKVIAV